MPDTRTAQIRLSDGDVVIVRIRNNARQSVSDAQENLTSAVAVTVGRRCPLLVDIRTAQPLAADVRRIYTGSTVVNAFTALALLVEASPMGTMMGNVYLRVARLGIPTKLFASEPEAMQWLDAYPADRAE